MDFHRGILPYKQEDNMSLFRKKKWDIEKSERKMACLSKRTGEYMNEVPPDAQSEIGIKHPPVSALEAWSGLSFILRVGLVALL